MVLLAWMFTLSVLVYGPGGPVPDPASEKTRSFGTQSQCERQRERTALITDSQGRLYYTVASACVEVPD